MIDAITRGILGEFGSALLDFYQQNALWINLIIFAYAFILWRAKAAYNKIKDLLLKELEQKFGEKIYQKNAAWIKNGIRKMAIDWHNLAGTSQFPLISPQKSLWFKNKSPQALQEHFTPHMIHTLLQNERSKG